MNTKCLVGSLSISLTMIAMASVGCAPFVTKCDFATPVYPMTEILPDDYNVIDTCEPVLRWKINELEDKSYVLTTCSVIVWNEPKWISSQTVRHRTFTDMRNVGEPVYFKSGIVGCSHKVEKALPRGKRLIWSVMPIWTKGGETYKGKWATYNAKVHKFGWITDKWIEYKNLYWHFATPE